MIPSLLRIVNDTSLNTDLRVITIEALGWYGNSSHKTKIIEGLLPLYNDSNSRVNCEAIKTINRLK